MMYIPDWITFQSYNASSNVTNYTTDGTSYVLFNVSNHLCAEKVTLSLSDL